MSYTVDIHLLQTLPPSLINRDDTGAPKSAVFGGVPRQRVSSQSWKRAVRRYFEDNFDSATVGIRTRRVVDLVLAEVRKQANEDDFDEQEAIKAIEAIFKSAGIKLAKADTKPAKDADVDEQDSEKNLSEAQSGYLLFLSPRQISNVAAAVLSDEKIGKKEAKELLNQEHSVDIAMFGRMVADDPTFNVDAAVQVAHALGIHESEPEFDYFTAVDDYVEDKNESGAGMIGTVQMMSSTLYRFATIDVASLTENLGNVEVAAQAAGEFVKAFVHSLPTGKQNTFANNTLPELVYVVVRDSRSISLVNAFEEPVSATAQSGRRAEGAKALAQEAKQIEEAYGFEPEASFVAGLGDLTEYFADDVQRVSVPEISSQLTTILERGGEK